MSTDENTAKVIEALNKARSMELQAIHQYMIDHYALSDMDYGQLCAWQQLIAVDEMRHAEKFAERVRALGGVPTCEMAGPVVNPKDIKNLFPVDINLEEDTIKTYYELSSICSKCGDHESAGVFGAVIKDELVHLQFYKDTQNHITTLGEAFLAKYAGTSKHTGPIKSFVRLDAQEKL